MRRPHHRLAPLSLTLLAVLAACGPAVAPPPRTPSPPTDAPPPRRTSIDVSSRAITWARVEHAADVVATPPAAGTWRLHLIDVGTGLALLVQGADFTLLYDAGTGDPGERPSRVLAYLAAALGPSGDAACGATAAPGPRRTLDHVVLSHPHLDHASALGLVLPCDQATHVWEPGRIQHTVVYREFVEGVAASAGATYHTAASPPRDRTVVIKGEELTVPPSVTWTTFSEGDVVALGADARFQVLHAEAKAHPDPNANSLVLALDLGTTRVLLTGDAESGPRADPSAPVGDVEAHLLEHAADALDVDILQVGHHGSKTSSRRAFLDAVSPIVALVSAGPKAYRGTVLPDAEVIAALEAIGAAVLRTDVHDAACDLTDRLGGDAGPGGCDSYVVTIVEAR
ncbi:MAG: MBL fold metallo-hydrolase [Kofleriaceae bacterium]